MSEIITVDHRTLYVLGYLNELSNQFDGRRYSRKHWLPIQYPSSRNLSSTLIKHEFLRLEGEAAHFELNGNEPIFRGENVEDWLWLTYDQDFDIIPIYGDGVAVSQTNFIVRPREIPNIVSLIVVDKKTGMDLDQHGFGYHFHFGHIRRNKLNRTDLLLTFDPADADSSGNPVPTAPLHAEKHGKGRYTPINISTIGVSKRRPIYHVCHNEMVKKGIGHFRKPSTGSSVFFP